MTAYQHKSPPEDHRRRPRKKKLPSSRDQAIFLKYSVEACTQEKLAQEYSLTQSRISQIIRRVKEWRAKVCPEAAGDLNNEELKRLDHRLERERHEAIYFRALRAYEGPPRQLTTTKVVCVEGRIVREEKTTREVKPDLRALAIAQRAALAQGKLVERKAPKEPTQEEDDDQRWLKALDTIIALRQKAEEEGRVARSECEVTLVEMVLSKLLALDHQPLITPRHIAPGTALGEFITEISAPWGPKEVARYGLVNPPWGRPAGVTNATEVNARS